MRLPRPHLPRPREGRGPLDGAGGHPRLAPQLRRHPRGWDFRSPGRGQVDFEEIVRALNGIGYNGPLSVEWEDPGMDREFGAAEAALAFVRRTDFPASELTFDGAEGGARPREGPA